MTVPERPQVASNASATPVNSGVSHAFDATQRGGDLVRRALEVAVAGQRLPTVSGLIRVTGDWELAADCFSDAVERALRHWPDDGVPDNPAAWLTTTAHRRALDVLRRRRVEGEKLRALSVMDPTSAGSPGPDVDPYASTYRDDVLRLVFTACHPALPQAGRVALTLRTVAGMSVRQIARAFLVSESTMGRRLTRTRDKIAHSGIRFDVPPPHRLAERTAGVLAVIYLIFNEGYSAPVVDDEQNLADEAVRLAQVLAGVLPDDDEARGLLALLLFQHARRAARLDADGELVPLPEQDRTRWDAEMIARAQIELNAARASGRAPGWYRIQAEIAAAHVGPPSASATDWHAVVAGYDRLLQLSDSPVVALNRAVAVGFRDGPDAGLAAVDEAAADGRLAGYPLLPAVRADLLRRSGRAGEAAEQYRAAIDLAGSEPERRFLRRRLTGLVDG